MSTTSKSALEPSGKLLAWDSEFWGVRVGHAGVALDEWAVANTIGCMSILVPSDDPAGVQDAEARGYRYMDVRVQFEMRMRRAACHTPPEVRWCLPDDVDALARLARSAHRITRFYADPRFADERCDDLYEGWIRNSVDGWAAKVLVAPLEGPVGYVTVHRDGDEASIGLIAVDESHRGHGLGMQLVTGAVVWAQRDGASRMTVVTQGRNVAAQRLFQRAGFVTCRTDVWLHRWYERVPAALTVDV